MSAETIALFWALTTISYLLKICKKIMGNSTAQETTLWTNTGIKAKSKQASWLVALVPKNYCKNRNTFKYMQTLKDKDWFIAVKPVNTENNSVNEVVYSLTEVINFWRQVKKILVTIIMAFTLIISLCISFYCQKQLYYLNDGHIKNKI